MYINECSGFRCNSLKVNALWRGQIFCIKGDEIIYAIQFGQEDQKPPKSL